DQRGDHCRKPQRPSTKMGVHAVNHGVDRLAPGPAYTPPLLHSWETERREGRRGTQRLRWAGEPTQRLQTLVGVLPQAVKRIAEPKSSSCLPRAPALGAAVLSTAVLSGRRAHLDRGAEPSEAFPTLGGILYEIAARRDGMDRVPSVSRREDPCRM